MKYDVRTEDGTLIGCFTGLAADNLMTAVHKAGSWRKYKAKEIPATQAFVLDKDMVVGEDRGHIGSMSLYLWAGTKIIPS